MCIPEHQAGIQAAEAVGLQQYGDPEVNSSGSDPQPQRTAPYPQPSTWTGMVDLDKEGIRSIAGSNESSEISEEHVVIHLRPGESSRGWGAETQKPRPPQEPSISKTGTLGLSALESLETHGGSAQEEEGGDGGEEGGRSGASDSPLSSVASATTPQAQTSNNMLSNFVNSLMRPFRYWAAGEGEAETKATAPALATATATVASLPGGRAGNSQAPAVSGVTWGNIPTGGKASDSKGSTNNAIMEHRNGGPSLKPSAGAVPSPGEGLFEQEKEVVPLVLLVPVVSKPDRGDTATQSGGRAPSVSRTDPPLISNGKMQI